MNALTEHQLQASIIAECDLRARQDPLWGLIFHVPNGGHRDVRVARKLQAEGVRAGVPDLVWPIARGRYHGLFMELKVGRNSATEAQEKWLRTLRELGYFTCIVFDDPQVAINVFQWYQNGAKE